MHRDLTISVVIPCYNEEEGVRRVIESLPKSVDEAVVVDNNCTDETPQVVESFRDRIPNLVMIRETRLSFTAARHAGARQRPGRESRHA